MPAAEDHPDPYGQDRYDELMRLNARLDDLVEAHHAASDPAVQADVAAQLRSIRQRIADLTRVEQRTWDDLESGVDDPYGLAPPVPFNEHDPFNDTTSMGDPRPAGNGQHADHGHRGHVSGNGNRNGTGNRNGNGVVSGGVVGNGAVPSNGRVEHNGLAIGTTDPQNGHAGAYGVNGSHYEPETRRSQPDSSMSDAYDYGANRAVFYEADEEPEPDPRPEPAAFDIDFPPPDPQQLRREPAPTGMHQPVPSPFDEPSEHDRIEPGRQSGRDDQGVGSQGVGSQGIGSQGVERQDTGGRGDGPGPVPSELHDDPGAAWDERYGLTDADGFDLDADGYDLEVDGVDTVDPFPAATVESFASAAASLDEPDPFADNFVDDFGSDRTNGFTDSFGGGHTSDPGDTSLGGFAGFSDDPPPASHPSSRPGSPSPTGLSSAGPIRNAESMSAPDHNPARESKPRPAPAPVSGSARVEAAARSTGPSGGRRPVDGIGGNRGLGGDSISLDNLPRPLIAAVLVSLALVAVVGLNAIRGSDETAEPIQADGLAPAAPEELDAVVVDIRGVLGGMGLNGVQVEPGEGTVLLSGTIASGSERDSAIGAATALAGQIPVDAGNLTVQGAAAPAAPDTTEAAPATAAAPGADAMQRELNRILASTPIIFDTGQVELTERHRRILNAIVSTMNAYPGTQVKIIGYTDGVGSDAANKQLSQARAQGVKDYLVGQGIAADSLQIEALGEQSSTGSDALALLERRVEFEVVGSAPAAAADVRTLKVAVVAPSARNDLAFTQSMVDAVNLVGQERPLEIAVTDSTFVPEEAAAAIGGYAEQGYDLVIAHGSQFGASLVEIAPRYPDTVFAWGTASDTFGLPNVYAYDAASQQGGYVLGALAATLSQSGTIGVVGPIEVGDAARYVNGFRAGAQAERADANVAVTYTGSFSDIGLASEAAEAHVAAGADVMTGSAQMVVGAVNVAAERGALWFGTQANQTSLAPGIVVASQVYRWEVVLRSILADIDRGAPAGRTYSIDLANGGIAIEYNPDFAVPPPARERADQIAAAVADGSIVPPG